MRKVILESPYSSPEPGGIAVHEEYARACVAKSLALGEAPIASHLLYTQPGVLNDEDPVERWLGINAGHAWLESADAVVVYTDFGISSGMNIGIDRAKAAGVEVEHRTIGLQWAADPRNATSFTAPPEFDFAMERNLKIASAIKRGWKLRRTRVQTWRLVEDIRRNPVTGKYSLVITISGLVPMVACTAFAAILKEADIEGDSKVDWDIYVDGNRLNLPFNSRLARFRRSVP